MSLITNYIGELFSSFHQYFYPEPVAPKSADDLEKSLDVASGCMDSEWIFQKRDQSFIICPESNIDDLESQVAVDTSSDDESGIILDAKLERKEIYDKEITHKKALEPTHERDKRSSYVEKNSKADKKAELREWIQHSKNKFLAERF